MICPFCKIDIEDDSFYCDQCGQEVLVCSVCSKPGKGKVCTSDGSPLVTQKLMKNKAVNAQPSVSAPVSSPPELSAAPVSLPVNGKELHLINKNLGLNLKIQQASIIGRTDGEFKDIFSKYPQVSKQHCQISPDPKGCWVAIDLGSTNGTKYNDVPLKSGIPQVISDKSYLLIANIEFYIEIPDKNNSDKTKRI